MNPQADNPTSLDLNDNDVVYDGGRGKRYVSHLGNVMYRQQVSSILSQYEQASSRSTKRQLCIQICNHVRQLNGRFLQLDPDTSQFTELDDNAVLPKIAQLCRNQLKENRKTLAFNDMSEELRTMVSSVCHIPLSQVTTVLSNSTIRKEVTKQYNSFSQGLKKTICPQSRLDRPNQSHPQAKTSAPPSLHATNNANKAINAEIRNIFKAHSQSPTDVPMLKSMSSSNQQPPL